MNGQIYIMEVEGRDSDGAWTQLKARGELMEVTEPPKYGLGMQGIGSLKFKVDTLTILTRK